MFRDTDKLSDNWRFSDQIHPMTEYSFADYLDKHGEERTLGYMDAIADIKAEIAWMLSSVKPGKGGYARTPSKTQNMLVEFEKHKKNLIENVQNHPVIESDAALSLKLKQR